MTALIEFLLKEFLGNNVNRKFINYNSRYLAQIVKVYNSFKKNKYCNNFYKFKNLNQSIIGNSFKLISKN